VVTLALTAAAGLGACKGREEGEATAHDPARRRVLEFWRALRAATEARVGGDCAKAVPLYEQALARDPGHEDGLYYLGQCRRELGQPEPARAAFRLLVERNPTSARGHLALGALLASPDPGEGLDLEEAERHLRRAHEINGEETGPMVRLAEVLLVTGRRDEARRWLDSALRTNPRSLESALLAGYLDWEESGHERASLVRRVREAAKTEAPVRGVLGEGDRRDARAAPAPPPASPLGRLLFQEPVLVLRGHGAGAPLSDEQVVEAWRSVRRLCREYERRARSSTGRGRRP
jgi:tetratricopeptide (TPR) repeat protein